MTYHSCDECGKQFFFGGDNIAHHLLNVDGGDAIDHDADANHVAFTCDFDDDYNEDLDGDITKDDL